MLSVTLFCLVLLPVVLSKSPSIDPRRWVEDHPFIIPVVAARSCATTTADVLFSHTYATERHSSTSLQIHRNQFLRSVSLHDPRLRGGSFSPVLLQDDARG